MSRTTFKNLHIGATFHTESVDGWAGAGLLLKISSKRAIRVNFTTYVTSYVRSRARRPVFGATLAFEPKQRVVTHSEALQLPAKDGYYLLSRNRLCRMQSGVCYIVPTREPDDRPTLLMIGDLLQPRRITDALNITGWPFQPADGSVVPAAPTDSTPNGYKLPSTEDPADPQPLGCIPEPADSPYRAATPADSKELPSKPTQFGMLGIGDVFTVFDDERPAEEKPFFVKISRRRAAAMKTSSSEEPFFGTPLNFDNSASVSMVANFRLSGRYRFLCGGAFRLSKNRTVRINSNGGVEVDTGKFSELPYLVLADAGLHAERIEGGIKLARRGYVLGHDS